MKISSDTSDSEEERNVTPTKKRKLHYEQKYSHLWEKDRMFSGWVKKSTRGDYYFYCESCKCDLKCGGGKRVLKSMQKVLNIRVMLKVGVVLVCIFFGFKLFISFLIKCMKELGIILWLNYFIFQNYLFYSQP